MTRGMQEVVLRGGPLDGERVEVSLGSSLLIEGGDVPAGMVARYRPTRERGVYRFREYDRIAHSAPLEREDSR